MDELQREIVAHYDSSRESERLTVDNRLELIRTQEVIGRHLPPPPAVVADIGGGPGVYASWLARLGHSVLLFDIVPRHVAAARTAGISSAIADARRIPLPDRSVDAALVLGPLYHLVERRHRIDALREVFRILRPGGWVVAAGISRFASAIDGLVRGYLADPAFRDIVHRDLEDGRHRNPTGDPRYFTTAYLHRPDELRGEVADAGLVAMHLYAVEGIGWAIPDLAGLLDDEAGRQRVLDMLRRLESEPDLLGASPHLLVVARRPVL